MGGICSSSRPFVDKSHSYNYDLIVIGGGSAGLACAKEAARQGAKVAICDYVAPSPRGSTWGLGGTCVNVGCIPKRLLHQSNLIKDAIKDSRLFGWKSEEDGQVDWKVLIENVQEYISSLNFMYKIALGAQGISFFKGLASFKDEHNIEISFPDDDPKIISGQCIVIAVGSRPKYLDIPGATAADNLCITSDDIFSLPYPPGKTLCIGGGYIGVECAGFLAGFGFDVTLMARSQILSGFDTTVVELLASNLEGRTVSILTNTEPLEIKLVKEGTPPTLSVSYKTKDSLMKEAKSEFNTVLVAVGRKPATNILNLQILPKIKVDWEGHIETNEYECTGIANIFALGDCVKNRPKLTSTAIKAGVWLARRLFLKGFNKKVNYENVPTTIFTPIEYGTCGLSEEGAIEKFGKNKVEIYHKAATPLEFALNKRDGEAVYAKLICLRSGRKERLVGFHYLGPNAGEITQGFSMPVRRKCLKDEVDSLVGIHPTSAEIFTDLFVSKRNMMTLRQQGC